jgi:hypothetical protein
MPTLRRMTIEVIAPIERVWQALATADGWEVTPSGDGAVHVVSSRPPDRVGWHVTGRVQGSVDWELDDLDAITFVHGQWEVGPSRTWLQPSDRVARQAHDQYAQVVAGRLVGELRVDLLTVRSDMRRPRHAPARPHRGAGAMLLGAMWLAGSRRAE